MTDTDYREKARALCGAAQPKNYTRLEHVEPEDPCPVCDIIAAALKAVAEEAVTAARDAEIWPSRTLADLQDKLSAYESATPESLEVKEALADVDSGRSFPLKNTGEVLARAYRSALVRIKELEADLNSERQFSAGIVHEAAARASAESALAAMTKYRDQWVRKHELDRRDLQSLRAKLAALRQPVGDEEVQKALDLFDSFNGDERCFMNLYYSEIVVRALRAKTAALKEAEDSRDGWKASADMHSNSATEWHGKFKEAEEKIATLEKRWAEEFDAIRTEARRVAQGFFNNWQDAKVKIAALEKKS